MPFTPRTMTNLPGLTRDPLDTKNLFAEDWNELITEVLALDAAIAAGFMNIGDLVGGSTPYAFLFADASGNLASQDNFVTNSGLDQLSFKNSTYRHFHMDTTAGEFSMGDYDGEFNYNFTLFSYYNNVWYTNMTAATLDAYSYFDMSTATQDIFYGLIGQNVGRNAHVIFQTDHATSDSDFNVLLYYAGANAKVNFDLTNTGNDATFLVDMDSSYVSAINFNLLNSIAGASYSFDGSYSGGGFDYNISAIYATSDATFTYDIHNAGNNAAVYYNLANAGNDAIFNVQLGGYGVGSAVVFNGGDYFFGVNTHQVVFNTNTLYWRLDESTGDIYYGDLGFYYSGVLAKLDTHAGRFSITNNGFLNVHTPQYATRTLALAGGLIAGDFYNLPIVADNKVVCVV